MTRTYSTAHEDAAAETLRAALRLASDPAPLPRALRAARLSRCALGLCIAAQTMTLLIIAAA